MLTRNNHPLRKTYLAIYLLIGAISIGIVGFMSIEGYNFLDALYMTIITLGTVGFSEVNPLTPEGKIFTIFLIVLGLVIFGFFITQISRYFFDGEFIRYFKMYNMQNEISQLKGHTIICGFGRNGREAARVLKQTNNQVVIIETDQNKLHVAESNQPYYFLEADATRDENLMLAGIMHASSIISTLPDDALNVFVCLTARELNPAVKIISRATHVSSIKKLKNAGANNVIMPDKIGGAHMAMLVNNPDIEEFIDIMSTSTGDAFVIQEITSAIEVAVGELDTWKKTGATIIGIKSGENKYTLNPSPEARIKKGDGVIIMGSKMQINNSLILFKN